MARKRKSGEYHEGNILPDAVGFNAAGELVILGDRAGEVPRIEEEETEYVAYNLDGSVAFRLPKNEEAEHAAWMNEFRDPNNEAIEIEDAGTATGEDYGGGA